MQLMLVGHAHAAVELVEVEDQLMDMLLGIGRGEIGIERAAAERRPERQEADTAGDLMALREAMLHRLEDADRLSEDMALLHMVDGEGDRRLRCPGDLGGERHPPPLAQRRDRRGAEAPGAVERWRAAEAAVGI